MKETLDHAGPSSHHEERLLGRRGSCWRREEEENRRRGETEEEPPVSGGLVGSTRGQKQGRGRCSSSHPNRPVPSDGSQDSACLAPRRFAQGPEARAISRSPGAVQVRNEFRRFSKALNFPVFSRNPFGRPPALVSPQNHAKSFSSSS